MHFAVGESRFRIDAIFATFARIATSDRAASRAQPSVSKLLEIAGKAIIPIRYEDFVNLLLHFIDDPYGNGQLPALIEWMTEWDGSSIVWSPRVSGRTIHAADSTLYRRMFRQMDSKPGP